MSADNDDGADEPATKPTLTEILEAGKVVIDDARATLADLDAAMNTAVNVIQRFALDALEPPASTARSSPTG